MLTRNLHFFNKDTKPKLCAIRCESYSIASIMAWYGAYHAGDRYSVFLDGEELRKDRNGEVIW